MIRIISVLATILFCGTPLAAWAQPYSEALIALQFAEGELYRRAVRIERLLKSGYRFTRVRVVIGADADALTVLIRTFVAQPAAAGGAPVHLGQRRIGAAAGRSLSRGHRGTGGETPDGIDDDRARLFSPSYRHAAGNPAFRLRAGIGSIPSWTRNRSMRRRRRKPSHSSPCRTIIPYRSKRRTAPSSIA